MTNETTGARDTGMPRLNPPFAVFLRRQLVRAAETYRDDGRKFAKLDDDALRERFISAFEAWFAAAPDSGPALNDVCAEYLIRRRAAPLELITDRVVSVIEGGSRDNPSLGREPQVVIAVGRWLFAPFMGALLLADRDDDSAAAARDFRSIAEAVRRGSR